MIHTKFILINLIGSLDIRTTSARVAPGNKVVSRVSFPRVLGSKTWSSNDYCILAQFE